MQGSQCHVLSFPLSFQYRRKGFINCIWVYVYLSPINSVVFIIDARLTIQIFAPSLPSDMKWICVPIYVAYNLIQLVGCYDGSIRHLWANADIERVIPKHLIETPVGQRLRYYRKFVILHIDQVCCVYIIYISKYYIL